MKPAKAESCRRFFDALRSSIIMGLVTLVILLVVESGSWISLNALDIRSWHAGPNWEVYSPVYGWRVQSNYAGLVRNVARTTGAQGLPVWSDLSRPGKRVLILGDSTAFGFGVADGESYAALLQNSIPNINVINIATPGYTTYQGLQRLQLEGDSFDPDVLIVAFGFNDRRVVLGEEEEDSAEKFKRYYRSARLRKLARMSSTLTLMQHVSRQKAGFDKVLPDLVRNLNYTFDELSARVPPYSYAENLEAIAAWGKLRDIPTVFLVCGDDPEVNSLFDRGDEAMMTGAHQDALMTYLSGTEEHQFFRLLAEAGAAKALDALGFKNEAALRRKVYELRLPFHGGPLRYRDRKYHQIIEEVATTVGGNLLDTTEVLADQDDFYLDFCHWTAKGHAVVAEALGPLVTDLLEEAKHLRIATLRD